MAVRTCLNQKPTYFKVHLMLAHIFFNFNLSLPEDPGTAVNADSPEDFQHVDWEAFLCPTDTYGQGHVQDKSAWI